MKEVAHKISSTVLALIILFSTFSFTVDKHYCGDYLVNTSVFSKAADCGMEMQKNTIDDSCETVKKDCCKNESTYVKGNDVKQQAIQQLEIEQLIFVVIFVETFFNSFDEITSGNLTFHHYKPPLIQRDIQVLFENFRI